MKRLCMEFLGTFFFILCIAMSFNPIAIASMLMVWVYIGAYVSGAHYNPLVSLAMAFRGHLSCRELLCYWLAQILGGIVAFLVAMHYHGHAMLVAPASHMSLLQAFVMEVLLSFVFALIILVIGTAEKYRGNQIFGFAIGYSIPALTGVGGSISGGVFNPAIAIGAAIVGFIAGVPFEWSHLCMYIISSFVGAILAAMAYRHFIAERHDEIMIVEFFKR